MLKQLLAGVVVIVIGFSPAACGNSPAEPSVTLPPQTTSGEYDAAGVAARYLPSGVLSAGEIRVSDIDRVLNTWDIQVELSDPVTLAEAGLEDNPLVTIDSTGELPAGQFVRFILTIDSETEDLLGITATDMVIPDITIGPGLPPPPPVNPVLLIAAFTAGISLAGLLFTWIKNRRRRAG